MPRVDHRNVLKGLTVAEAMRRQVVSLPADAPLEKAIRFAIKYKVNALLVTGEHEEALGVVSKTDLMGAYYAGLPLAIEVGGIMVGPPLFCHHTDSLDAALDLMRTHRIHRLYVAAEEPGQAVGVLAYPDIVGLLYRFCHRCDKSILKPGGREPASGLKNHFRVREVMTPSVTAFGADDSLLTVMEGLAAQRLAAVLIRAKDGAPLGVVSKSDLIVAYLRGLSPEEPARAVMNRPVAACGQEELLALAIKQMIFADIHRLFVYKGRPEDLVGVLSLSDAARFRSGTCRACLVSRIRVEGG